LDVTLRRWFATRMIPTASGLSAAARRQNDGISNHR
jgi:hypothetical protein